MTIQLFLIQKHWRVIWSSKKVKGGWKIVNPDKMYWNALLVKIGHVKPHRNMCFSSVCHAFHVLWTNEVGNSEICFPETFNKDWGRGHSVFCYNSQLKNLRKNLRKNRLFDAAGHRFFAVSRSTTWSRVPVESFYFPRKLASFVRPEELASFDQRHVTRPLSIGKRIWVVNYDNEN